MRNSNKKAHIVFLGPAPANDLLKADITLFTSELRKLTATGGDKMMTVIDFPEEGLLYDRNECKNGKKLHPDKSCGFLKMFLTECICVCPP